MVPVRVEGFVGVGEGFGCLRADGGDVAGAGVRGGRVFVVGVAVLARRREEVGRGGAAQEDEEEGP